MSKTVKKILKVVAIVIAVVAIAVAIYFTAGAVSGLFAASAPAAEAAAAGGFSASVAAGDAAIASGIGSAATGGAAGTALTTGGSLALEAGTGLAAGSTAAGGIGGTVASLGSAAAGVSSAAAPSLISGALDMANTANKVKSGIDIAQKVAAPAPEQVSFSGNAAASDAANPLSSNYTGAPNYANYQPPKVDLSGGTNPNAGAFGGDGPSGGDATRGGTGTGNKDIITGTGNQQLADANKPWYGKPEYLLAGGQAAAGLAGAGINALSARSAQQQQEERDQKDRDYKASVSRAPDYSRYWQTTAAGTTGAGNGIISTAVRKPT